MTKIFFKPALAFWLVAYAAAPTAAVWPYDKPPSISAEELLRRVAERYETLGDFRADVAVVTSSPFLDETSASAGVLYARPPNLLRVELSEPFEQTVIFDGEFTYAYAAGSDQVIRYGGPGLAYLTNLAQTLEDLSAQYDISLAAETAGRAYELRLNLKKEPALFRKINLWVDRKRLVPLRADFYDDAGNRTSYRFSGYRFNQNFRAGLFALELPAGAEIVDAGGQYRP
jgi:outer membrane lipoprotein-sorting protein